MNTARQSTNPAERLTAELQQRARNAIAANRFSSLSSVQAIRVMQQTQAIANSQTR